LGKNKTVSIGLTTLTVMFAVLALTIFAVLSLSTAHEEAELAGKYAESVLEYQAADSKCAGIANELTSLALGGAGKDEIALAAAEYGAAAEYDGGALLVSYSRAVNDVTTLYVTLRFDGEASIERWQTKTTDEGWEPDYSLPVWKG